MLECFFHGHSFIEIMLPSNKSLLIDPFINGNKKCELTVEQVLDKDISTLILTHGHHDHIGDTLEIVAQHPEIQIIAPTGIVSWLETQGVKNPMQSLNTGDNQIHEDIEIQFVPAAHDGKILETEFSCIPV